MDEIALVEAGVVIGLILLGLIVISFAAYETTQEAKKQTGLLRKLVRLIDDGLPANKLYIKKGSN